MAFARNQWYVAAWAAEVRRELLGRTICGEPVLMYRRADGSVAALANRCVHRRFPLSSAPSQLVGDRVVCGYHGFTYEPDGVCSAVPGQTRIPSAARLHVYPVVEQDALIWVWIGEPERARPDAVPRAPHLDRPGWLTVNGMEPLAARSSLLLDNLLDLSHETYLHGGYIGTPEVAATPIHTDVEGTTVRVSRRMDDAACPPFYTTSTGLSGRITRWQDIEFEAPCLYRLHSRIAPRGVLPDPDGSDPGGFHIEVMYAITPETEGSTHDFWAVSRDFALEDDELSEFLRSNNRAVVLQDVDALNQIELVLRSDPPGTKELSVQIDKGGLAGRRVMAELVRQGEVSDDAPELVRA
jgi:phenylpropionate dioxygenase-like ring-hydroxylating dioxygenase large terminal subunit